MQFIDLQAQYRFLQSKIDRRIQAVLQHGKYIMGPEVQELEQQLATYTGVQHVISCANGTDALQLALMAMGVGEGDAVFCPTFTFFASAEVIALAGATPVFVDVDATSFNICVDDLHRRIDAVKAEGKLNCKAIIAVDLFGLPADYTRLQALAHDQGMLLLEDAAQGFGGTLNGQKACSFGDIATTSFFPAKPLGGYGDGGAVFTNNDQFASLIRSYRVHGKGEHKYDNVRIGLNSRLDTIQAAILIEKLAAFDTELVRRQQVADAYAQANPQGAVAPMVAQGYTSSWAQYTLISDSRDAHMAALKTKGVPTTVYYQTCMHQQTAFAELGYKQGDFPVAEKLASQVFSLPMHGYMSDNELNRVCQAIRSLV